ncbi:hypothetical protein O9929_13860 [Vibrio lentus]|nr:hypothetical protein [Vibrio lentus]
MQKAVSLVRCINKVIYNRVLASNFDKSAGISSVNTIPRWFAACVNGAAIRFNDVSISKVPILSLYLVVKKKNEQLIQLVICPRIYLAVLAVRARCPSRIAPFDNLRGSLVGLRPAIRDVAHRLAATGLAMQRPLFECLLFECSPLECLLLKSPRAALWIRFTSTVSALLRVNGDTGDHPAWCLISSVMPCLDHHCAREWVMSY